MECIPNIRLLNGQRCSQILRITNFLFVFSFSVCAVIQLVISFKTFHFNRYTIDIAQNEVIAILSLISHWLCYANSAINPLIYNFMSGKYKMEAISFHSHMVRVRLAQELKISNSHLHNLDSPFEHE